MSGPGKRYTTNRRTALKLMGASSLAGLTGLAGCSGGDGGGGDGGDGGDGGSTTTTTSGGDGGGGATTTATESEPETVEEWRAHASEMAAEELSGDESLVVYTSERNPEYIDYRSTNLAQTLQEDWVADPELYEPLIDNFENITGSRGDLVNRYAQEQSQGRNFMDLLEGGAGSAIAQGVPFGDVTQVKTVEELPEDVVNDPNQLGLYLFAFGPVYNSEVVEFAPTTYEDLLDPSFADNAIIADFTPPPDSAIPVLLKQGADYLRQVADQEPQFVESLFTQMQRVAQGEAAVAWQGLETQAYQFLADDFPLELAQNNDVWVWAPQWMQFAAEPAHPWAARLWTDFLVRPEHTAVQTWDQGTLGTDLETANPSSLGDLFVQGENEVWSSAKYDRPSNELLDEYLEAMGAPV